MVRTPITPYIDVEGLIEQVGRKKTSERIENKQKIVLVGVRATEIVDVFRAAAAILNKFEHQNKILSVDSPVVTIAGRRMQRKRSKIHQEQQLTRLQLTSHLLVLFPLPEVDLLMLLTLLQLLDQIVCSGGISWPLKLLRKLF